MNVYHKPVLRNLRGLALDICTFQSCAYEGELNPLAKNSSTTSCTPGSNNLGLQNIQGQIQCCSPPALCSLKQVHCLLTFNLEESVI